MKLSSFCDKLGTVVLDSFLAEAGYGRLYDMEYHNYKVDPRPLMLILGKYRHPSTRNILAGGINLHYINNEQLESLRKSLKKILQYKDLKQRYRAGARLLPDIFANAYRTYNVDHIRVVTPSTLKFWNPNIDDKTLAAKKLKNKKATIKLPKAPTKVNKVKPIITKKRWADKKRQAAQDNAEVNDIDYEKVQRDDERAKAAQDNAQNDDDLRQFDNNDAIEEPTDLNSPEFMSNDEEEPEQDEDILDDHQYVKSTLYGKSLTDFDNVNAIYNKRTGEILIDNINPIRMLASSGWGMDGILVENANKSVQDTVVEIINSRRRDA